MKRLMMKKKDEIDVMEVEDIDVEKVLGLENDDNDDNISEEDLKAIQMIPMNQMRKIK